jgi:hypothetical protein
MPAVIGADVNEHIAASQASADEIRYGGLPVAVHDYAPANVVGRVKHDIEAESGPDANRPEILQAPPPDSPDQTVPSRRQPEQEAKNPEIKRKTFRCGHR